MINYGNVIMVNLPYLLIVKFSYFTFEFKNLLILQFTYAKFTLLLCLIMANLPYFS